MARPTALPLRKQSGISTGIRVLVGTFLVIAVIVGLIYVGTFPRLRRIIFGATPPTYETMTIGRGNIAVGITATGPVSAVDTLPLTFKTAGKLADLKVNVGDHVTKGQVLATLDPTDLQAGVDQAKANVAVAQAQLAKVQVDATDAQKEVAQTAIENAQKTASDAQTTAGTVQQSAAQGVGAARAGVSAAQTNLNTAQSTVASAKEQEDKGLAADQIAVQNAQKAIDAVQATIAANQTVAQQQIEAAKDALWAAQTKRDQICGQGQGSQCDNNSALVAQANTQVNVAATQLTTSQKQGAQQVSLAQSQLATAQAQYNADKAKYEAAIVQAQNQVKQSQAAVNTAQAALAQAQAQAAATSQQATSQLSQARGAIKSAQAQYDQVVAPALPSDVQTAQAQIQAAQAALEVAQNNRDAAVLTAPFDGTVAAVSGTIGQWVTGGPVTNQANALITLVDLQDLQVTAQVNEADIGKVKVGDPVTLNVAAFPDKSLAGQVIAIQPVGTVVQNVVNYDVTSTVKPSKDVVLYPGMTATVTIISAEKKGVVVVPNAALAFGQDRASQAAQRRSGGAATPPVVDLSAASDPTHGVVYLRKGAQLTPVPVTLGMTDGTNTEVVSGLTGGEAVVVAVSGGQSGGAGSGGTAPQRPGGAGGLLGALR